MPDQVRHDIWYLAALLRGSLFSSRFTCDGRTTGYRLGTISTRRKRQDCWALGCACFHRPGVGEKWCPFILRFKEPNVRLKIPHEGCLFYVIGLSGNGGSGKKVGIVDKWGTVGQTLNKADKNYPVFLYLLSEDFQGDIECDPLLDNFIILLYI